MHDVTQQSGIPFMELLVPPVLLLPPGKERVAASRRLVSRMLRGNWDEALAPLVPIPPGMTVGLEGPEKVLLARPFTNLLNQIGSLRLRRKEDDEPRMAELRRRRWESPWTLIGGAAVLPMSTWECAERYLRTIRPFWASHFPDERPSLDYKHLFGDLSYTHLHYFVMIGSVDAIRRFYTIEPRRRMAAPVFEHLLDQAYVPRAHVLLNQHHVSGVLEYCAAWRQNILELWSECDGLKDQELRATLKKKALVPYAQFEAHVEVTHPKLFLELRARRSAELHPEPTLPEDPSRWHLL